MSGGGVTGSRGVGASRSEIEFHYDLSDKFYALWLDPGMTYSCAKFEPGDTLESAQRRKLDYHVERAQAARAARVLDVGCGWGSLLSRLVGEHGVRLAVGLTLSHSQSEWIEAHADPGVSVRLESWVDHEPEEPYDAIVSIGALEHFANCDQPESERLATYRAFFEFCHRSLRPGGRLSLQTIALGTLRLEQIDPFIREAIFPSSHLPYSWHLLQAADRLFELVELRNDREDYARTCRAWFGNLQQRRDEAVALVGERRVLDYERYLRMSAAGFEVHALGLLRMSFERLDALA